MRLARLALQEFRVYADLDLALPAGVVGIYGPNGAGKSTLLDAILWTLFGVSKGAKDGLRRDGSTGECRAEVTFEHGGLTYEVARSISAGGLPRAEARCGGRRLASGSTAVRQYVHQVLGMSAEAFRASVFCEQKHLDGFSGRRPEERRRLVLDLLGITPLDGARDHARADARLATERVEAIRGVLGDRELLAEELSAAERALLEATERRRGAESALRTTEEVEAGAQRILAALEERKAARARLLGAFQAAISRRDDASKRVVDLKGQLAELAGCQARLLELEAAGGGLAEARARLRLLETVELARRRVLAAESGGNEVRAGDPGDAEARARHLTLLARQASERLVGLRATKDMAVVRARQADEESKRAAELDGGAACPLCGQELGAAFESVRLGRERALAQASSDLAGLEQSYAAAAKESRAAEKLADDAELERQTSLRALEIRRLAALELERSQAALANAVQALGADHLDPEGELERLRSRMPVLEEAREQAARLGERVRRAGQVSATLEAEEGRAAEAAAEAARLLAEGQALGFEAETYEAAVSARTFAGKAVEDARSGALEAQLAEARIAERVAGQRARSEREAERARELLREEDRARHLGRLSE
ncbi:MAG: AAA family ATPase, partial [Acidimicrobiia bacterium]